MRSKEMANDYRYFPEGDLVSLNISDEWVEKVKSEIKTTIQELRNIIKEIAEFNKSVAETFY